MKKASKKSPKLMRKQPTQPITGKISRVLIKAIEANQKAGEKNAELSRRSGVSHSQITRWLSGEREISFEVAEKLCEALGLELRKIDDLSDSAAG